MSDGAPGLEVGFEIDTGSSHSRLDGLTSAMDAAEARITRDAALIERATSNMVQLGGATVEVTAFGNATDRATQTARSAYARTEKQVEGLIRSLERKTAVYGLSKDEAMALRVEELALTAATQKNTDAAQRLRDAYAGLYDKQFAEARRTRAEAEALAQTREAEANATAAAAERKAQELRSAALAHAMFTARVREGAQAMREQEAAQRALDMERHAQEVRSAALAYNLFEARAREGAQAMREAEAAQRASEQQRQSAITSAEAYAQRLEAEAAAIGKTSDQLRDMEVARRAADTDAAGLGDQADRIRAAGAAYAAAQAQVAALADEQRRLAQADHEAAVAAREAAAAQAAQDASLHSLRSSVDPLYAAQQRLMRELESAARLYRQGAIGQEEYGRSSEALAQRLDEVQRAQARQTQGTDEAVRGSKLGANDLTNIAFQIQDIIVSLQGGQKPLTVLMQQGSQLGGIMMQTGASFGDMVRAVVGLAIVSRPAAAAAAALAEAEAARAAAHTAAGAAGSRAAIAAAELIVAEEAAARAAVGDTAAQNALALARTEAAATAELAAAANRQLAASQTAATASAEAAAASASRSLAPWLRTLSAYAVPVAAVGVGIYALNQNMNDNSGLAAYARGLDLTKAEMKKLGDQTVTTGDMLTGLATTMGFSLDGVGTTIKGWVVSLGEFFGNVIKGISAATYGLFVGSYRAIVETWQQFPAVLGDLFVQAVNGAAKSIEWLVNKSIDGLNAVNPFEKLGHVEIGGMENRFAGAGRSAGEAWGRNLDGAVKEALDGIDGFMGRWTANSQRAARDRLKKQADELKADRADKKDKPDRHAERLAREAEAIEAQIRNLYGLADAYKVSAGAALIAEARVKAESQAIKQRGDIEASVDRQVRLSIAQRVADAAKADATTRAQARAQADVNRMVEAGLVPAEQAGELLRERMADLPLLAALEAAQQRNLLTEVQKINDALRDQRRVRAEMRTEEQRAAFNTKMQSGRDRLAELEEERRLIGATDMARVRALATIRATQEARTLMPESRPAFIAQQVEIAEAQQRLVEQQADFNQELRFTADLFDTLDQSALSAARGMSDAFGAVGTSLGDLLTVTTGYFATDARLCEQRDRAVREAGGSEASIARENRLYALRSASLQVNAFGNMTTAAKGFFEEGSAGWRAVSAAEKAARAVESALSVRAIAQDAIETGSKLATSAARAAASGVEAVAKAIASLPFPANLAAGAATVAALASIGIAVGGAFGSNKNTLPAANDGSGSVLGDSKAQSESIRRALDALKEVDTLMLGTSRDMAASLRSIERQIGGVASLVVRAGNVNANAGISEGFQRNLIGSVLGKVPLIGGLLGGLFGSSTKIIGGGLYGSAQSLGDILSGGFDASYYSDTQKTKKFFGIKTGTSYSTSYTGADSALEDQFTLILRDFNSAILAAAGPLGAATSDIQSRLNGFVVNLGKIDLQGLTGEQIQEKLTAVFGAAADRMAGAAFPGVERFQRVGEGAFETLVRVASTVETVTASLDQLGFAARGLGIDAKMGLAGQFESLSAMTQAAGAYFEAFYTPAEQNAARLSQMTDVFVRMGVTMPNTLSGFRALVEAQDLNTAAGQAAYATLLQLAPAFADLQSAMTGAKSAADILAERQDLERQMLELSGNTEAIRALDLARLDASNRALQQQVWAVKDAQDAAKAADDLRKAWSDVGASIEEEIRRIRGLNDTTGGSSFMALQGQFNAQSALARGGDQEAAKLLPSLSQALLKAAGDSATSRQELDRIQAATASSLEATFAAIQRFSAAAAATPAASAQRVLSAMEAAPITGVTGAPVYDDMASEIRRLREEVALMRAENNTGNATIASNTSKAARTLENVTSASGGEAIAVANAA